jgi:ribose 1,5-bisphosphokinase
MGPAGAGKDAVLCAAREKLNKNNHLYFSNRYVTRPTAASGASREISLTEEEFANYKRNGLFALDWRANGLSYGVSRIIDSHLMRGKSVVVSGSRAYLREGLVRYPSLLAVQITVPREIARQRLIARGRETPEEIEARLARSPAFDVPPSWLITIDNSGALEDAVDAFCRVLLNECVSGAVVADAETPT